jgi:hypothetical protein
MAITISQALYTLVPKAEWSITGDDYSTIQWFSDNIAQPTKEAVEAEVARLEAQAPLDVCKKQAKKLLADTDWSVLADAAASLVNQADFITYRAAVRALVINPVANPSFPTVPTAQWSSQ